MSVYRSAPRIVGTDCVGFLAKMKAADSPIDATHLRMGKRQRAPISCSRPWRTYEPNTTEYLFFIVHLSSLSFGLIETHSSCSTLSCSCSLSADGPCHSLLMNFS